MPTLRGPKKRPTYKDSEDVPPLVRDSDTDEEDLSSTPVDLEDSVADDDSDSDNEEVSSLSSDEIFNASVHPVQVIQRYTE